jgi:formiminoglutamase
MNGIFEPLRPFDENIVGTGALPPDSLGSLLTDIRSVEESELGNYKIAFLGVQEDRQSVENTGCAQAPDFIRHKLYRLKQGAFKSPFLDLGNLQPGHTITDTYFALSSIVSHLVKLDILPVILGGGQDLTYAQYCAYESLEQTVNLVSVDAAFDLGDAAEAVNSRNYLGKIVLHQPNCLFNFSNIGFQSYFVGSEAVELISRLYFDAYRLGNVRANIEEVEPVIRNADLLSVDISAVRQSDAPGNAGVSPNGFYGEEICQLLRYAGLSDKLSSLGLYEVNPSFDHHSQTSHLVAQMIWYFLDGFASRKKDLPVNSRNGFVKYRVTPKNTPHEIVFYKSRKTDKWWMEVPYMDSNTKYQRHHIIPCSYADYQSACNEEIPERWWQTFQKLV